MRKFILVALSINALLLAGRFWQEWRHVALAGGGLTAEQNGDVNGDARLDMSDAIYLLLHIFRDGPGPVALADSPELLERVARLEEMKILGEQGTLAEEKVGLEKTLRSKARLTKLIKEEF